MINKLRNKWIEISHPLIRSIVGRKLTYLDPKSLKDLKNCVEKLEKNEVPGMFLEAGSALGGSAIFISKFKSSKRTFQIYDMFGMIPEPSERDTEAEIERYETIKSGQSKGIRGDEYYGYKPDLKEEVIENFKSYDIDLDKENIALFKGDFRETMKLDSEVAFAHIDCDWYDSVYFCLKEISPRLSKGGIIILDDYFHWPSCKKATEDFLKNEDHDLTRIEKSKLYLVKK